MDIDFYFFCLILFLFLLCLFSSVYEYSEYIEKLQENPNHPTYKHKIYLKWIWNNFCSKQYNFFFIYICSPFSYPKTLILIIIIYTTENLLELKSARYGLWFSIIVPKSTTKLLDNIFELFNFKRTIYYDQKFYMKFLLEKGQGRGRRAPKKWAKKFTIV